MSITKLTTGLTALAILAACTATPKDPAKKKPGSQGAALYAGSNCALCHGSGFEGTALGPKLENLSMHWNVADLAEYIADPEESQPKNARLRTLTQEFNTPMPAFDGLTIQQRTVLAQWLLTTEPRRKSGTQALRRKP